MIWKQEYIKTLQHAGSALPEQRIPWPGTGVSPARAALCWTAGNTRGRRT